MKIDRELLRLLPFEQRIEFEENIQRKPLVPSELATVWRRIQAHERAAAKARQGTRTDQHPGNFPGSAAGNTRHKIGAVAGVSGRTLEKIVAICDAAEAEPERFGRLRDDMDRSGKVNPVYKRLRVANQAASIRADPPPLPGRGPYRVIVADPPWPFEIRQEDPSHRAARPYPTMSIKQICAIDVASIAHADCAVWLWTINYYMRQAYEVLDAWGFEAKTILTWAKDRAGFGIWLRSQTELHPRDARQARRRADQPNNIVARSGAWPFGEAERVLRSRREALPGTALLRSVLALQAQREVGLPRRRSAKAGGGCMRADAADDAADDRADRAGAGGGADRAAAAPDAGMGRAHEMSGARHRRKGNAVEREIVDRHKALGIHAERYPLSGSSRFRGKGHDVDVYLFGPDQAPSVAEVKGRKNGAGFTTIEGWLADYDLLFLRRNNADPLIVLPWRTWARLLERRGR
jgi:hypothetical protein